MADGSIVIDSKIDGKQFDKDIQGIEKKLQATGKSFEKIGKSLTTKVSLPIAGLFAAFAKSAMDLEATEAKYETVFQGMTDESDAFIKEFQKLTPATTAEARLMASGLQDLLVPMGFAREEATEMTGEFMHVAGALANFNSGSHTAEDVTNALSSAITGQYKPLQSLGIQLDANTVKNKAVEMGLMGVDDEMTNQIRTQVLLEEVYGQSTDALEAYTEENLDAKTKMGLAKAEAIDLAAAFGEQLLPMINDLIDNIREVITWFSELDEEQKKQIMTVMAVVMAIGPLLLIIGKVISAVSGIIGVLTAMNPVVLIIIAVIAALTVIFVKLWQENEVFRDKIMEIWDRVKTFISTSVDNIKTAITKFIQSVKAFWDEWGEDILRIAMDIFTRVYEFISTTIEQVSAVIKRVIETIQAFWDRWGEDIMSTAITIFTEVYQFISKTIEQVMAIIEAVIGLIMAIWDKWGADIVRVTSNAFNLVMDTIKNIWDSITQIIDGAMDIIQGVIQVATGLISGDWEKAWEGMKNIVKGVANVIGGIINGIIGAIESMVNAVGRAVNGLPKFDIPDWVPVVGGNSFGLPNVPRVNIPRVPSLDIGTDKVMNDGLAMIHKGESIVPANVAQGGFSGNGNDQTEKVLKQILQAIKQSGGGGIRIDKIENHTPDDIPSILEKAQWIMSREGGGLNGA